jgi:hypothetical protein
MGVFVSTVRNFTLLATVRERRRYVEASNCLSFFSLKAALVTAKAVFVLYWASGVM